MLVVGYGMRGTVAVFPFVSPAAYMDVDFDDAESREWSGVLGPADISPVLLPLRPAFSLCSSSALSTVTVDGDGRGSLPMTGE